MTIMYHDGNRRLQDQFDSRRIADRLEHAFEAAVSGRRSMVLLTGEPGIGKTTLCRELAAWVVRRGGLALVGRCDDAGALSASFWSTSRRWSGVSCAKASAWACSMVSGGAVFSM